MKFSLFTLMFISTLAYAELPVVYRLNWVEDYRSHKLTSFVSVSDKYRLNEHEDSLAIPDKFLGQQNGGVAEYIPLKGTYRQRCLNTMNISDNDIVYIYDYAQDKLLRFYVRGLNLIAVLSPYSIGDNYPVSQYDYMIGFEINQKYLYGFEDYYSHVLVSIAKTNPFTRGKMKPIKWTKVDSSLFPKNAKILDEDSHKSEWQTGETYQFKMNNMTCFVQNIGIKGDLYRRHVIVINSQTKTILFNQIYKGSESASPSPLNYIETEKDIYLNQFVGQLFKNQPLVIFGFMYQSFGCPSIDFIDIKKTHIYINCDNRH